MKEAMHYKKLKEKKVQCNICPRKCIITDSEHGFCRARKNEKGKLYSLVYAAPCAVNIDPIEKKPLFHFLPGTKSYSLGTAGCNLRCKFCQNWQISQAMPENIPFKEMSPEQIVQEALANDCKSIAYTYTEPTVFYEYVYDIAKLAKKSGLKNIMITNGFINQKPLKDLYRYIDAANVDLKGSDDFYKEITGAWLQPILDAMVTMKKMNVWLEITNLLIPGYNDDKKWIQEMCSWIKTNLSPDTPLHFSRFFPDYLMTDVNPTPEKTLIAASRIAKKSGLNYVYIGNIQTKDGESTFCPECKSKLIERQGYLVTKNIIKDGKCTCKNKIPGIWNSDK